MTYSLTHWINPRNEADVRLYVQGTTRRGVYLTAARSDGRLVWSSKTNDTPTKQRSGDHWGKCRKDGDAAGDVCEAFGLALGQMDWDRAVRIAKGGIEIDPSEAVSEYHDELPGAHLDSFDAE